jgi:hypothetical protein
MKNMTVSVIIIAVIVFLCVSCIGLPVRGNGAIATTEQKYSSFNDVHLTVNAMVNIHSSPEYRMVLTADSNLMKYVIVKKSGDTLLIKTKWGRHYSFTHFVVDVYCPRIDGISTSSSGNIVFKDKFETSRFSVNASSSGGIEGNIECDSFTASVSSSGDIKMTGSCRNANINLSSSGNFYGNKFVINDSLNTHISSSGTIDGIILEGNRLFANLSSSGNITITGNCKDAEIRLSSRGTVYGSECKINNCDINISGSGGAYLWIIDNLEARISGSGTLRYRGDPKFDFNSSGSGKIIKE